MTRSSLDKILRLRVVGVITKEMHGRDIIERLIKNQTTDVQSFEWQMQLRFYWERTEQTEECIIRQTITRFSYHYVFTDTILVNLTENNEIVETGIFRLCKSFSYFTIN